MMPPVVTALCSYVPPVRKLDEQVSAIEPTATRPLTGWDAWMALWRTECTSLGPTAMPRIGPGDRSLRAPVAHTTDLSGLAAYVTRAICAARPRAAAPVDVVIFCHSSVDEHISTTTAGRLASVVGAPDRPCFSFSISQQGSTAPFTALRLAQDLFVAERDLLTVLIAAAEKWVAPFSRHTGTGPLQGDAAAAVLLERFGASTRGLRLIDAQTHPCPAPSGDSTHRYAPPDSPHLQTMLQLITALLAKHAISPCDVIAIGQCNVLAAALQQQLGIASLAGVRTHDANLGAADTIEQLTSMAQTHTFPSQGTLLLWNIAPCGYVGCALLDAHSAPVLARSLGERSSW
ncbi:beta-ketoacyl-[acyl-carrier-protein] synthase family protein [Burkholderia sola]|uniref:3-oxoacyl-ACP synthase n=1 Tax=Burkholderia sola TaxID=2843302 RepID=UPI0023DE0F44|nr:3-oxoacyl-ACP synthase [Burkholderia sola]